MRPEILFSLFGSIANLSGVGPKIASLIDRMAGPSIIDLCWHLPTSIIDRRYSPVIAEAQTGVVATITARVASHDKPQNRRSPYRIRVQDESGEMLLVFFNAREDYLRRLLPEGEERVISGQVEDFQSSKQMTHPDHVLSVEDRDSIAIVEPVYPLTASLSSKVLTKAIRQALEGVPELPEWLDSEFRQQRGWPDWRSALLAAHRPQKLEDVTPQSAKRCRLAYDELLANQLALALVRARLKQVPGRRSPGTGALRNKLIDQLPFALTSAQERSVREILADIGSDQRMLRLLQGDVGSGKTVVALLAMLCVVEDGRQAALLAPTEILARQHFNTLTGLMSGIGVEVRLLTGRDKTSARGLLLEEIASGRAQITVGTHALFQESVAYHDLALAVIDEQHRFGVHQRLSLAGKGVGPVDVLLMTATPIPRTLTLTSYGDMDISRLDEKPPGRTPVNTRIVPVSRLNDVTQAVARAIEAGTQVYWVCPLIEESEDTPLAAAEDRFKGLRERFGDRVGLVHGRMRSAEKDETMERFVAGEQDILVATTVIEVGVDVPNATIMVVEHAERFGLAQLHQLRGRVGRGAERSICLLLYAPPLSQTAEQRLRTLRDTDDGFVIAEEDLRLRGAGELLGTRQSGLPEFRLADLAEHAGLLPIAHEDVRLILRNDANLTSRRGAALRVLLYLFGRDDAIKYLRSG